MRTFHIGGVAQGGGQQSSQESSQSGKVHLENAILLKNSAGEQLSMTRNMVASILDVGGAVIASYKVAYGSKMLVKDGQTIERGDKLF